MKFNYVNNILYLPCYEAKSLKKGKNISILFEVAPALISGDNVSFNYSNVISKSKIKNLQNR